MHRVRSALSVPALAILAAAGLLSACDKPATPTTPAADAVKPAAPAVASGPASAPVEVLQPEAPVPASGKLATAGAAADNVPVVADPVKGPGCNLEVIAGKNTTEPKIESKAGSTIAVSGWMFSFPTHSIPVNRYLRVETEDGTSAWQTIVGTRSDRPDILPWFNVGDWALNSGFSQDVDLTGLSPGRYHLLLTYTENGKSFACDNGRLLNIVP